MTTTPSRLAPQVARQDLLCALRNADAALEVAIAILSRPSLQPFLKELDRHAIGLVKGDFEMVRSALAIAQGAAPAGGANPEEKP